MELLGVVATLGMPQQYSNRIELPGSCQYPSMLDPFSCLSCANFKCFCFFFNCRRKQDANVTIETLCHDPAVPLYGHLLDDYNNTKCKMKEKKAQGSVFYICSCSEVEECNDLLKFSENGELIRKLKIVR